MTISLAAPPSITPPLPERPTRRALRGRVAPALSGWSRDGAEWPSVFLAVSGDTQTWSGGDIENWSAQAGGTIRKIRTRPYEAGDGADGRAAGGLGSAAWQGARSTKPGQDPMKRATERTGGAAAWLGSAAWQGARSEESGQDATCGNPRAKTEGMRHATWDGRAGGACLTRGTAGGAEWLSMFRAATHTTWGGPGRAALASPVPPQAKPSGFRYFAQRPIQRGTGR